MDTDGGIRVEVVIARIKQLNAIFTDSHQLCLVTIHVRQSADDPLCFVTFCYGELFRIVCILNLLNISVTS